MTAHGGSREGAGRTKGKPNKKTAELKALALKEAPAMFKELARIATSSDNDGTRVAAIKEIFDRAYGKPSQTISGDSENPLIPDEIKITIVSP